MEARVEADQGDYNAEPGRNDPPRMVRAMAGETRQRPLVGNPPFLLDALRIGARAPLLRHLASSRVLMPG